MALKQVMLSRKIQRKKTDLEELLVRGVELKKRSDELEAAINEATTDEEIAAVEEEVAQHETDKSQFETDKGTLESDIAVMEEELGQLQSNEPGQPNPAPNPETPAPAQRSQIQGGESRMYNTHYFRSYTFEQRRELVQREGVKAFLDQVRALAAQSQTRSVSGADLTIPDTLIPLLRDNIHRYSKLIRKVNLRTIKGTARQNITGAIPEAVWTEACASLNELELLFNQIEADGYKVGGFIPVCNATLEDSDEDLAVEILDAISQAIGLAVDKAILYGTGQKMPLGITRRLAQASKPSDWKDTAPEWTDLRATNLLKINRAGMTAQEFFAQLLLAASVARPNYSNGELFWAMNRTTYYSLLATGVTFNAAGAVVAQVNNTLPLIGGEIIDLPFIPDGDIIGGYGSLYLLIERKGMQLARSEHVRFIQDETVFRGTARYDGKPVFGEAFVAININNADPTTTVPFAPDNANPSDAYLSALALGSLSLSPAFNPAIGSYTATTANASNTITATAAKSKATVAITVNGSAVTSGGSASWTVGSNDVVITVTNGTTVKAYTVAVTRSS